jgi:hypothetical protein
MQMGNPCYADDFCAMCFNPAKNWQIGWYDSNTLLLDPRVTPSFSGRLVGKLHIFDCEPNNYVCPRFSSLVVLFDTGWTCTLFQVLRIF